MPLFHEIPDVDSRQPSYDEWLLDKVRRTMTQVATGKMRCYAHDEAMAMLRKRLESHRSSS